MTKGLIAKVSTVIYFPCSKVWDVLVNPEMISQFMFGTQVVSDWKEGSSIMWNGVWNGKPYQDKGKILKFIPGKKLMYSHFSPLAGLPDVAKNYHTLTYELFDTGENTLITLTQDNNSNKKEMEHSQNMWQTLLFNLKRLMEN